MIVRKNRNKYLGHEYEGDLIYFKYWKINKNKYYTTLAVHGIEYMLFFR